MSAGADRRADFGAEPGAGFGAAGRADAPVPVRAVLEAALLGDRAVAWQRVEPAGAPGGAWRELAGEPDLLGALGLVEADFGGGVGPGGAAAVGESTSPGPVVGVGWGAMVPWVHAPGGRVVDAHLCVQPDAGARWVVLIDRTAEAEREQLLQQRANELALTRRDLDKAMARLERAYAQLDDELRAAAAHVRALLPAPGATRVGSDALVGVEWRFVPSSRLGGDVFGYGCVGSGLWRVYMLDVCGHGVGAALLAVSARNAIESGALPDADPADPASVLAALAPAFPMEANEDRFFTVWYGVWDAATRRMTYASAGHHPAVLLTRGSGTGGGSAARASPATPKPAALLGGGGGPIGMGLGAEYQNAIADIPDGARLWLFSDAAFEARRADGTILGFDRLVEELATVDPGHADHGAAADLDAVWERIAELTGAGEPADDYSLVRVRFGEGVGR